MILDSNIVIYAIQPEHAFLRQQRKIGLADSLIAATAMHQAMPLITRNLSDFSWIPGLHVINPFEDHAAESGATVQ